MATPANFWTRSLTNTKVTTSLTLHAACLGGIKHWQAIYTPEQAYYSLVLEVSSQEVADRIYNVSPQNCNSHERHSTGATSATYTSLVNLSTQCFCRRHRSASHRSRHMHNLTLTCSLCSVPSTPLFTSTACPLVLVAWSFFRRRFPVCSTCPTVRSPDGRATRVKSAS